MHTNDDVTIIRCRADNYAYLMHDADSGETVLVDAPEAGPILEVLARRNWTLTHLLLTHHHDDHIEGTNALRDANPGLQVIGAAADAHRLPPLDRQVAPGDVIETAVGDFAVFDAPGHTVGHIAFHLPARAALFSGDSLMVHGCGRLFEGTAQQMFDTIARFMRLPGDTRICSGHDYAAANLAFAATCAPDAAALDARRAELPLLADKGHPTVGVTLAEDIRLNPYMRAHLPEVKAAVDMDGAPDLAVFAEIRRRKDAF